MGINVGLKLGKTIYNAVKRSTPVLINGKSALSKKAIFSLKNPYILEAIPDGTELKALKALEGKNLERACRFIDNPDAPKILARYSQIKSGLNKTKGFSDDELKLLYKKAFPNIKVPTNANTDAMVYLTQVPDDISILYDAHGLAKISVTDQLKQLNKLLTKGIDKSKEFYTAPLGGLDGKGYGAALGVPGGHAYRDGSFILVSGKNKTLLEKGIQHVIVNDAYYNIIEDLARKFPNINFVKAEDVVEYFAKL